MKRRTSSGGTDGSVGATLLTVCESCALVELVGTGSSSVADTPAALGNGIGTGVGVGAPDGAVVAAGSEIATCCVTATGEADANGTGVGTGGK